MVKNKEEVKVTHPNGVTEPLLKPKIIETSVSVSIGGKVQLRKYEIDSSYYFSQSAKWEMPGYWTDEQAGEFRTEKTAQIKAQLELVAQEEVDKLFEQRTELNK